MPDDLRRGTLALSWGPWGGFYFMASWMSVRLCLGWVALTWVRLEFDDLVEGFLDDHERRRDARLHTTGAPHA